MYCPNCGTGQPDEHRFCIACGVALPRELLPTVGLKITDYFAGIVTHETDASGVVLRVSRYLEDIEVETEDGPVVVPGHHSRFSIWEVDRPVCAMSLSDDEAERLARFLTARRPDTTTISEPSLN